jgi:hypothetical protein
VKSTLQIEPEVDLLVEREPRREVRLRIVDQVGAENAATQHDDSEEPERPPLETAIHDVLA